MPTEGFAITPSAQLQRVSVKNLKGKRFKSDQLEGGTPTLLHLIHRRKRGLENRRNLANLKVEYICSQTVRCFDPLENSHMNIFQKIPIPGIDNKSPKTMS